MPVFEYRGYRKNGKKIKGEIEASTLFEARNKLKSSGVFVEHIKELSERRKFKISLFSHSKRQRFVYFFTRQMAFMLEASVPVINAIEGIIEQTERNEERQALEDVKERIREGESFSSAIAHYPEYFNQLYVNTVKAGELSGNLAKVFVHLSEHFERNQRLIGSLRSSLTYPIFMLVFAFVVVIFLVTFIVPSFSSLFEQFGQRLPLPTRVLLAFSGFISSFWWLIVSIIVLIFLLFRNIYKKNDKFRRRIDSYVLRMPLSGNFIITNFRIRFSYTMSLMIANGVGLLDALVTTRAIFKNSLISDYLYKSISLIKKGEKFSRSIEDPLLFPPSYIGMVRAGERGDRLAEVLDTISRNLEASLEEKVKSISSLVEPLIIIIIGGFVGFVVLSIMLPIFQINQLF